MSRVEWSKMSREEAKALILTELYKYDGAKEFEKARPNWYRIATLENWWHEIQVDRGWTPKVQWNKVGKEEGVALMRKIASFYATRNEFQVNSPGVYKKAVAWGVLAEITSHMPKLSTSKTDIDVLTEKERLKHCKETAQKYPTKAEFHEKARKEFDMLKGFGIDKFNWACAHMINLCPDRAKVKELAERRLANGIVNCKTFFELLAEALVELSNDDIENVRRKAPLAFFKNPFVGDDVELSGLDDLWLEEYCKRFTEAKTGVSALKCFIVKQAVYPGLESGLAIKCFCGRKKKKYYFGLYLKNSMSHKIETIRDMVAYYWSEQVIYPDQMLEYAEKMAKVSIETLDLEQHVEMECIDSNTGEILNYFKMDLRSHILAYAANDGVISRDILDLTPVHEWFRNHKECGECVPLEKRTLLWYAVECYKNEFKKWDTKKRSKFKSNYGPYEKTLAKDFSSEDRQNLSKQNVGGVGYIAVLEMMYKDGLITHELFETQQPCVHDFEFDIKEDVWEVGSGRSLDFRKINNMSFRQAAKHFLLEYRNSGNVSYLEIFADVVALFEFLDMIKIDGLEKLNNLSKLKFYDKLKEMSTSAGPEETVSRNRKRAERMLGIMRTVHKHLHKIKYEGLNPLLSFKFGEFRLPKTNSKIHTYSHEQMKKILKYVKSHPDRLHACAIGLVALLARRVGEVVQGAKQQHGNVFQVDSLRKIGLQNELCLVYSSSKQNAEHVVPLSVMIGSREDPFAEELLELVPRLWDEALAITEPYRQLLPLDLRKHLFVEKKIKGGYGLISYTAIRTRFVALRSKENMSRDLAFHEFRHTMATELLLSGSLIQDAADALCDEVLTVQKHYHAYAERLDTLKLFGGKLKRQSMCEPIGDAEKLLAEQKKNRPNVITPIEYVRKGQKVVGGECLTSPEEMVNCKSYQMTHGGVGCASCWHLTVIATVHSDYWRKQLEINSQKVKDARGNELLHEFAMKELKKTEWIDEELEQKELEYELSGK